MLLSLAVFDCLLITILKTLFQVLFLALCDNVRVNFESLDLARQLLDRCPVAMISQASSKMFRKGLLSWAFVVIDEQEHGA